MSRKNKICYETLLFELDDDTELQFHCKKAVDGHRVHEFIGKQTHIDHTGIAVITKYVIQWTVAEMEIE